MEVGFGVLSYDSPGGTTERNGQPVRKLGRTKYLSGISFILPLISTCVEIINIVVTY